LIHCIDCKTDIRQIPLWCVRCPSWANLWWKRLVAPDLKRAEIVLRLFSYEIVIAMRHVCDIDRLMALERQSTKAMGWANGGEAALSAAKAC
jgi:hypothetical protein